MADGITRGEVLRAVRSLYADGPWLKRTLQRYRPHICPFEALIERVPPGSKVLDVGCGSGLFLTLLAHRGRLGAGFGFDLQQEAIAYADKVRRRLPDPSCIEFVHASGTDAWPATQFDVVSMVDVMHHIAPGEQHDAIAKVARALRPGGLFIYKDMVTRPLWRAWANRLHDLLLARQWIHYLPLPEVVDVARRVGLTQVEYRRFDLWCYGHELAVFRRDGQAA